MESNQLSTKKILSILNARWDLDVLDACIGDLIRSVFMKAGKRKERQTKSVVAQSCAIERSQSPLSNAGRQGYSLATFNPACEILNHPLP